MKLSRKRAAEELARRNLCDFVRLSAPYIRQTPFHKSYYQVLNAFAHGTLRKLIVTVPPQHGKSQGASVLLPAYLLGIRPECKIAVASYNTRLASRFNRQVQQLMDTAAYRGIFPNTRLKTPGSRASGHIRTNEEFDLIGHPGGMLSVGREGTLTGNPVDIFILDDLYKDALEANSPLIRDNTWEWYNAVVKTRLHNDSQELIVFTRWHEDDLIGRLLKNGSPNELSDPDRFGEQTDGTWNLLNFEAIKEGPSSPLDPRSVGMPLWPERHGLRLLLEKRGLDPVVFETMYQGRPATREGLLYGDRFATYDTLPAETLKQANYTDTADTGDDFLCSVCYETTQEGHIYLTDIVYTRESMETTETQVADMLERNETKTARIESNNGGRGFARAVSRLVPRTRIEWFHQSRNKEARILTHATEVLRRIVMPADWRIRWPELYCDLISYRRLFRSNRRHDAADVLTGIIETETETGSHKRIRAVGFAR